MLPPSMFYNRNRSFFIYIPTSFLVCHWKSKNPKVVIKRQSGKELYIYPLNWLLLGTTSSSSHNAPACLLGPPRLVLLAFGQEHVGLRSRGMDKMDNEYEIAVTWRGVSHLVILLHVCSTTRLYNFGSPRCSHLQVSSYSYVATRHMIRDLDFMGKKPREKKR